MVADCPFSSGTLSPAPASDAGVPASPLRPPPSWFVGVDASPASPPVGFVLEAPLEVELDEQAASELHKTKGPSRGREEGIMVRRIVSRVRRSARRECGAEESDDARACSACEGLPSPERAHEIFVYGTSVGSR